MKEKASPGLIQRMMEATGSKRESHLAQSLRITPQSLYNAKRKGRIPPGWVMEIAVRNGVSLDWLYFGEGEVQRSEKAKSGPAATDLDKQTLSDVLEVMEESLSAAKKNFPPGARPS